MQGVGPGSLLGGRYVVQRRVSQHTRYERWTAADQTLDREVVLLCFDAESPQASAALDAARRAAGIEEPRLVRVLDVGSKDGVAFVVEEPLIGARSITAVLGDGPLPAEEARRVVGEAASALETARVRGLHHQVLTTRSLMRLEDGSVKVRGLATEAALLEAEENSSDAASRADAVSLVSVAYAVLTGRWPITGPDSGLEAAPRVVGGVAAPSEIAAGVPADLDLIARLTLNEDKGPLSPGDLAGQIGPWSPTPLGSSLPRQPGSGNRTEPLQRDPATRGVAAPRSGAPARQRRDATAPAGRPAPPARATTRESPSPRAAPGSGRTVLGMGIGTGRPTEPASAPFDGEEHADEGAPAPAGPPGPAGAAAVAGTVAAGAAAGTAAVAKGLTSAIGAAGTAASSVGSKFGGLARTTADRAAEKSNSRAERRQTESLTDDLFDGRDMRLSDALEETDEAIEPAMPILAGGTAEPLDRDGSKLALILVGVLVLVAALLGIWGLPKPGTGSASDPPPAAVSPSAPTTAAPAPSTPAPTTSAPAALTPVAIVNGQAWDPQGDNQEGNASVPRAYDANPDTQWRSQAYNSADFGGYAKNGIGLVLDLGQQTDVHEVDVELRGGADMSVYVASTLSLDGATQIGTSAGKDGTVTIKASSVAKGQLVILWFTHLAPDGQGKFRAQVAEARVL